MGRFATRRQDMVRTQLRARGIRDPRVLEAMGEIPRQLFVDQSCREHAYRDCPLQIGFGQTISQPYIVALMCEALSPGKTEKVLDVGTGSGYGAAVLAALAGQVITVERVPELAEAAARNLELAQVANVQVHVSDGSIGYAAEAPYDAIAVAAGAPEIPSTLKQQLNPGGRLVIPVGPEPGMQDLLLILRNADETFSVENLGSVAFVPLVGADAWPEGGGSIS